ncbi:MAG: hypothetical protein ACXAEX_11575 [Promethearchaeota archaeon]
MAFQSSNVKSFSEIFSQGTVISISGASGTGKTSLALYLIAEILKKSESSIWIQASEPFPKSRLESMYNAQRTKLKFLLSQIYIAPGKIFSSYPNQFHFLEKFVSDEYIYPPDLRFLVIDNISHHLRFYLSTMTEIKDKAHLLDEFYDSLLYPLIIRCQREKITLILIHEVSFNFKEQKNVPFFYKLYNRIKGVTISLNQSIYTKERTMELIFHDNKTLSLPFKIEDNGFVFL